MAEMIWKKVFITKDLANQWLDANPRNRQKKVINLERLKNDIIHGHFECTHQGIAIAEDGEVVDGQHRLCAIAETGVGILCWVCFNAPKSTKIDIGASRSTTDSLYMAGVIDKGSIEYCSLTHSLVSMMVQQWFGRQKAKLLTADEKHAIYLTYKPFIDVVIDIARSQRGKGKSAPILYAMLCAVNACVTHDVLKKWFCIVASGDFYSEDPCELKAGRSVLLFKNFIESNEFYSNSKDEYVEMIIKKAMSSINHFWKKNTISRLYGEWVYPKITMMDPAVYEMKEEK